MNNALKRKNEEQRQPSLPVGMLGTQPEIHNGVEVTHSSDAMKKNLQMEGLAFFFSIIKLSDWLWCHIYQN